MRGAVRSALFALALMGLLESPVLAQGGSAKSTITGTVVDTAGGVLPGATVIVRNAGTSVETATVTNSTGVFDVPALDAGTYTITISLSGFRTAVLTDVELLAATTRSVKATLDVGQLTEAVEVRGGAQLVQTQSTAVSSTIRADQMATLPLVARNALNFVVFLPGVDTSSNNHSQRSSTIMGLPQSTLSVTVDGSNVQDKYTRSGDGFFANLQPRLDMVEEVTVSSATAGADSSGQGAVQIKFVTRSGTNKFVGSVYEYTRHQNLNSNTWLNLRNGLARNVLVLNQYGGREGGPIVIPGWYDGRGKAFFFVNMEQLRFPLSNTRTRIMLSEPAQQGVFRYAVSGATRQVNLFEVAARCSTCGQAVTPDPTVAALLARIRSGTGTTGIVNNRTDPNTQDFLWQPESLRIDNVPTVRLDFNLGSAHRLSTSFSYQGQRLTPNLFGGDEPNFPGLGNQAELYSAISRSSTTLRSTFGKNLVNEVRVGWSNGPVYFADSVNAGQFEDQAGFDLVFPNVGSALTGATTNRGHQSRNGKSWNLDNTINWLSGKHSVQFGAAFTRTSGWMKNQNIVPQIQFGVDGTNDPANAMFVDANFPGASSADLGNARSLYAFLTGRVISINSEVRLDGATGQYVYMGLAQTAEHQDELGLFVQDSWRLRPNVTINAGLRWQLAFPFRADASVYSMNTFEDLCGVSGPGSGPGGRGCNLFNPGVFNGGGRVPTYERYESGHTGYRTEYDNFAPNVGVAWQPAVQGGWLRGLLGDPDLATLRASFGIAYNSDGLSFFRDVYNANPGSTVSTTRSAASAQFPLVPAGQRWPLLLRESDRLGASPGIPTEPVYPMAVNFNSGVNLIDPYVQDAVDALVFGRTAAGAEQADGRRGPLRRHAARRRHGRGELERAATSRPTGFSTSSGSRSRTSRCRSRRGAARPDVRRARSPIRDRAPGRIRSRSISPTSTASRARSRAVRGCTQGRTGSTPRGSMSWRRAIPIPPARWTRSTGTPRFAPASRPRASRGTSSSSIPTSTTPTSPPTAGRRPTTRCRSTCAGCSRRVSRSTPTTRSRDAPIRASKISACRAGASGRPTACRTR